MIYIIPARKGSKGFPGKNRKLFHCTAIPLRAVNPNNVIVTTDDKEIIKLTEEYNFKIHERPEELATDTANIRDVLLDVIDKFSIPSSEYITMLYLTYPTRTFLQIADAQLNFYNRGYKSQLCYSPAKSHPFYCVRSDGSKFIDNNCYRRQNLPEAFEISHFTFVSRVDEIKNLNENLYNKSTKFFLIDNKIDVDTKGDYAKAKELLIHIDE